MITITGFDPECYPNYLYIYQGDGTFAEQAVAYGVANLGCGLATALMDYDRDGDIDIMVANDFGPWHISNSLYQNNYPAVGFSNFTVASWRILDWVMCCRLTAFGLRGPGVM